MIEIQAGPYTLRGISVGGVYTSIQFVEWGVLLDAGVPMRSAASVDRIFLSHGHPDHASALVSLLGIRRLIGKGPPKVFAPVEIATPLAESLKLLEKVHRCDLSIELTAMSPGEVQPLGGDKFVRAFRTHHGVPSLGYAFFQRVTKLRPEHQHLPGLEIARLRREGTPNIFETQERCELAYATDTLADVLEAAPEILEARVLIFECTFVDEHRTVEQTRSRNHTHLDELIARADRFRNEWIVLMHFSQAYSPRDVHRIVSARIPLTLRDRVIPFAPEEGRWFG